VTEKGQLVFASLHNIVQIWSLPLDMNRAQPRGEPRPLTTDSVSKAWPSASDDGKQLSFTEYREGHQEIWIRNVETASERCLTPAPTSGIVPVITYDGSQVAFGAPFPRHGETVTLYTASAKGGAPAQLCRDCGYPSSWSHDNSKIIYNISPRGDPTLLDVKSGRKQPFLAHPEYALWAAKFSPDDRWVVFSAVIQPGRIRMFIVPFPAGAGSEPQSWIPISGEAAVDTAAAWSPDGNRIYFVSQRDGWPCIWTQALHPATRHPVGSPTAVTHFHTAEPSIRNVQSNQFQLSSANDQLIFNLGDLSGNIWLTRLGAAERVASCSSFPPLWRNTVHPVVQQV
jgi:eukaryotic-like serine/threonine-protein kinase